MMDETNSTGVSPLAKSSLILAGIPLTLFTHRSDTAHGAVFRGELNVPQRDIAELEFLKSSIAPGSFVLDIGANMGAYGIMMAKSQPTAKLFCFEPDPVNFSLLNLNLLLNEVTNISAFNFAVGRELGFVRMYLSNDNFGDHRSAKPKANSLNESTFRISPAHTLKVSPMDVLPIVLADYGKDAFDLVKIDTQGADFEILEAVLPLLRPGSIVSIEYSPYHLSSNETSADDVARTLANFSGLARITPANNSFQLIPQTVESLLQYYKANAEVYRGYWDLALLV